MILADTDIKNKLQSGEIGFTPLFGSYDIIEQIGPASLDFRLGNVFKMYKKSGKTCIDVKEGVNPEDIETIRLHDGGSFVLHPGDFVLGVTLEKIRIPHDLVARCEGRSSLGRLGLIIHSTAGYVDPGFEGTITLEMTNINVLPIRLYVGMKIGQYAFQKVDGVVESPYDTRVSSKYMGQIEPEESRIRGDN